MESAIPTALGERRSARDIAGAVNRLISDGTFPPGHRLPTVRDLARDLGVSPSTVSEAWQHLAAAGAIESRGRNGTVVREGHRTGAPRRYRRVTEGPGHFDLDLSTGVPDAELLPDLRAALAVAAATHPTTSYLDEPVLPALEEPIRELLPFEPRSLTVTDGSMDAMDRLAAELVRFGDRVLVENPAFPPLLDLLEALGAEVRPLAMDEQGVTVESLRLGLLHSPVAVFLQPRAQNPTGVGLTPRRAKELAGELAASQAWVIEDDHAGAIASAKPVSLGKWLPERTIYVLGFSKSHGPDLRLAAVAGAAEPIERLATRRLLGPGWSSRILQQTLAVLLRDARATETVAEAGRTYAQRRSSIASELTEAGIATTGSDGINLWVEVPSEQAALVRLAASGIGAAPGRPFEVEQLGTDHLRITSGLVSEHELERVAAAVVSAGASGVASEGRRPT